MIISAHQPAYLPWLGFFHKILLSDVFVVMDDVQFEKNSFTNRNKIVAAGQEVMLTIPVRQKGHTAKTVSQIEISDQRWRKKHLRSIEQAYRKAPGFETVFEMVAAVLNMEYPLLIDYTNRLTRAFLEYLDIGTTILFASDLKIRSQKLEYVIELTEKAAAPGGSVKIEEQEERVFVFGSLGKDYADENRLGQVGIRPYFQNYQHPQYRQTSSTFMPYMSILDLIFNEPKGSLQEIILSGNTTKAKLQEILVRK